MRPIDAANLAKELLAESAELEPKDPRRAARLASSIMSVYLRGQADRVLPSDSADRVTAEELAAIARLDAAATPGPWHVNRYDEDGGSINWQVQQEPKPHEVIANISDEEPRRARHDAALIVLARTLLPKLAAEVTALRASLRTIDVELDHAGAPVGPEDGSGVYTADGRVIALGIALGLALSSLRAEQKAIDVALEEGDKLEALREKARAVLVLLSEIRAIDVPTEKAPALAAACIDLRAEVDRS